LLYVSWVSLDNFRHVLRWLVTTCCGIPPDDAHSATVASPSLEVHARTLFRRVDRGGAITSRVSEPQENGDRQDLITFCRMAGWKLAQLHDVDVVPCYHVNGRLNVLGRDKRVCSPTIYVIDDKFGAIDPTGESRSDTFFESRELLVISQIRGQYNDWWIPSFREMTFSSFTRFYSRSCGVNVSFVSREMDIADNRKYGTYRFWFSWS